MTIFHAFDRIRVINLPSRNDRRRAMERELRQVGLADDPRVEFFDAIRPVDRGAFTSIGARGIYLSQREILREAAHCEQSVLILEDDCCFTADICAREFPSDWEIFYGGYTATSPGPLDQADIEGAHMMGFSVMGARMVADYLNDLRFEGIHPPIDAAYVWFRRAYPNVPTLFASPPLAGQRSSRSDIAALKWYDRTPVVREFCGALRSLARGRNRGLVSIGSENQDNSIRS